MGKLTQYAVNALMKVPHPEIERRQCWNLHPHRTPCTACKDVCPMSEEIFTRPSLVKDWDACINCGPVPRLRIVHDIASDKEGLVSAVIQVVDFIVR